ncbi:MAG: Ig-like domain-containing protein [Gloeomargarita sp. SKYB31]|nr:Ig-like domain-containing protein [Gloeomargarita sp. SKYB31]
MFKQPLDRAAIAVLVILALVTALLLSGGDQSRPRVQQFSWQERVVGAQDQAFILTFNRPMNTRTVEQGLRITPELRGKVSWAGRRMAYTLLEPVPYGQEYQVQITGAKDKYGRGQVMEPFTGRFRTRDQAFIYVGTQGDEAGRLVLHNLTQGTHRVLTPPELVVLDAQPLPQADRIVFSAQKQGDPAIAVEIYTVTTGLQYATPAGTPPRREAGQVAMLLPSEGFQNLKFDLSPDGQKLVVARASLSNSAQSGLWQVDLGGERRALQVGLGGDFRVTPDGQNLVMAKGQGLALLPLQPEADPLEFLPKFGQLLEFDRRGTRALMVKFNSDFTRSLFLVGETGEQELLRLRGSILSACFDPRRPWVYVLATEASEATNFQELPYLAAIVIPTKQILLLVQFADPTPPYMALSPDGRAMLLEMNGHLWRLALGANPVGQKPEDLGLWGRQPRWLP